jgi:hypothetical protein
MEDKLTRPEFFQLYSSVNKEIRQQLEIQFQQLTSKISMVNRLLIESSNLVREKKSFQSFHDDILDAEFRKAFGFTEIVIVYLYKLKENDFDRVYVPERWADKKKAFMEQAIKDLRSYYFGGEQSDKLNRKEHLFLDIIKRVKEHRINEEFQSYTFFLKNIKRKVIDEGGTLNLAPESERIFKNEMLIITPLHNEVGEFWVTVNTYVHKHNSLFGQIRDAQFDLLKKWYVTAHETISECFLAVAHLLRLREKTLEQETLQRISIISYLLSHPSVKLFTTPLKNAADDLRMLNPSFPDEEKERERFESSLDNVKLITDLWEGNLVVLEEFGAIEGDNNYSLDCPKIGSEEWEKIEDSLAKAAQVLFFNHINDLYDDQKYNHLVEPIRRHRKLEFSDFFKLKVSLKEGTVCYGHQKLIILHLISFLENAIEAADFTRVAEAHRKYGRPIDNKYKNQISYRLYPGVKSSIIEVQNDCRVRPQEEENLMALSDYIKKMGPRPIGNSNKVEVYNSLGNSTKVLAERKFTTKSGTGFGWAVILAADYFKRLSVVNREGLKTDRRGDLSLEVLRDKSKAPVGVKVRIQFPIPKKPGEKVKIENTAPEER